MLWSNTDSKIRKCKANTRTLRDFFSALPLGEESRERIFAFGKNIFRHPNAPFSFDVLTKKVSKL